MGILVKVVGGVFAVIVFGIWLVTLGLNDIRKMPINEVDLKTKSDGKYTGAFKKTRWNNEVEVTVENHRITAIKNINKLPPPNQKVVDKAIRAIINQQSIIIDVISGASANTKSFQKAVENALSGQPR